MLKSILNFHRDSGKKFRSVNYSSSFHDGVSHGNSHELSSSITVTFFVKNKQPESYFLLKYIYKHLTD